MKNELPPAFKIARLLGRHMEEVFEHDRHA